MRKGTGSVYQRKEKRCLTCRARRPKACEAAGHEIEVVTLPTWWIRYSHNGRSIFESSGSAKKSEAIALLQERQGELAKGAPPPPRVKLTFEDAALDLVNEYKMNGRRSLTTLEERLRNHLEPFFKARQMSGITTTDVRAYVVNRQGEGASNGTINRELTALKRMFTLALRAEKIRHRPHIPLLKENNVRRGFFEPEQFEAVKRHLKPDLAAVVTFAYVTGWRTPSEILPLEWRQVDFKAAEVRLDPGTTKNGEGRVFPFTAGLRRLLEDQRAAADRLQRELGRIVLEVFVYDRGTKSPMTGKRITESGFHKAWGKARTAAGCPGRIPHDFRRTAVRNLERAGVSRSTAMKLTGHLTEAVYRRYAIVSSEDLRDAARRLDATVTANRYSGEKSQESAG